MKIVLALFMLTGLHFAPADQGSATVNKIQGVEIYVYSSPTKDYEVIESGKVMLTLTGSCDDRIKSAANKAAKMKADGLIIELGEPTRWTAIRYKPE